MSTMSGRHRLRVDRLEEHIVPAPARGGIDPKARDAWLRSLSDSELDFLGSVAERFKDGEEPDDLDTAARPRFDALMAAGAAFVAAWTPDSKPMPL